MKIAYECQLCEGIYFDSFKALKDHLECYHPEEFKILQKGIMGKEYD